MGLRDIFFRRASAALRKDSSAYAEMEAIKTYARQLDFDNLVDSLKHPRPCIRRLAARSLGAQRSPLFLDPLSSVLKVEKCDTVRIAVAGALIRSGRDWNLVFDEVKQLSERRFGSAHGPKIPGRVTQAGTSETIRLLSFEIGRSTPGDAVSDDEIAELTKQLQLTPTTSPDFNALLFPVASQGHPKIAAVIEVLAKQSGRHLQYAVTCAMGLHGDLSFLPWLYKTLLSTGVNPAQGFKMRTLSGVSIGQIGDPSSYRTLTDGLRIEARVHEGTPGSGLGIQFPVRSILIWAMGEVANPKSSSELLPYLSNTSGGALSGFDLPSIAALYKLGEATRPSLAKCLTMDETTAANAAGILGALGPSPQLDIALTDQRASVSTAAQDSIKTF